MEESDEECRACGIGDKFDRTTGIGGSTACGMPLRVVMWFESPDGGLISLCVGCARERGNGWKTA
jgi:hypothetical protein